MNHRFLFVWALIFIFSTFTITGIAAVSINTIVQEMEKSYQRQMSGVEDITIVQEMKGGFFDIESVTYQKKSRVNNQIVFKSRSETNVMGMNTVTIYDGDYSWSIDPVSGEVKQEKGGIDALQVWKIFNTDRMEYLGEEEVNGRDAYKVVLDGAIWMMGKEDMLNSGLPEDSEIDMHSIYWIDQEDYVPLKSKNFMTTTTIEDGKTVTMNIISDVQFLDYRPVGSMLISHRMVISNQMDVNDPSLSPEEKEEAQAFMNSMGAMGNMEFNVKSIEMNTGLSDELFDGTLLEPGEPMFEESPGASQDMQSAGEGPSMSQEDIEAMMESLQDMMKDIMPNN